MFADCCVLCTVSIWLLCDCSLCSLLFVGCLCVFACFGVVRCVLLVVRRGVRVACSSLAVDRCLLSDVCCLLCVVLCVVR